MAYKAWYFLSALVATLLGFTLTAHAAALVDPADGSLDVARTLYSAFSGGHYAYAGAIGLILSVSLLRKYGGSRWPALHTDGGAALLALGGAFGTSMAAALAGGGAVTWPMFAAAGATAFAAMGGYATVKKTLVEPYVKPWSLKAPAALKPLLAFIVYWFEHASDTQPAPAP